jgi:hypothetical protein
MKLRFKKGDKVKHSYAGELGKILEIRTDPQGYNYYVEFPTRTDWFKEDVLR